MSDLKVRFGKRLRKLRRNKDITQEQLAEAVECSVEFISLVERGVNAPSVAGLEKFAKVLKVEVKELFAFQGKKR